jgi:hypothetical protein
MRDNELLIFYFFFIIGMRLGMQLGMQKQLYLFV